MTPKINSKEIIAENKKHQIICAGRQRRQVFDFLSHCRQSCPEDMRILESWVCFFRQNRVPFVVTCNKRGIVKLWKLKKR
jgi:hypothetical protein